MRTVLIEDMSQPRSLGRPADYAYPLSKLPVLTATTDDMTPCYESAPIRISTAPAFLIMCKAAADVDAGAIRLLLSRTNQGFATEPTTPAFTYSHGLDHAEVVPIRLSELGGGNVFAFATTAWVDTVRVRLLYPVESFAVYLLTYDEAARYNVGAIDIAQPMPITPAPDPFLADDFEQEP